MEENKYRTATKIAIALFEGWQKFGYDEGYLKSMTGALKDVIYQCPSIHSGYVSEEAYELSSKEICKEHFYSRTQSAKKMIDLMQKGILNENRLDRFESFMKSRARIHYVTSKENNHLIKFQNDSNFNHWKHQYEAAGIKLKVWDKTPPKYIYNINGIEYNSPNEAAEVHRCYKTTVIKRCDSDKEKWKTWKRELVKK